MKDFNLDKQAQPKISKIVKSANVRQRRIASVVMPKFNKKYCRECGFRIRGENHAEGTHHKGVSVLMSSRH